MAIYQYFLPTVAKKNNNMYFHCSLTFLQSNINLFQNSTSKRVITDGLSDVVLRESPDFSQLSLEHIHPPFQKIEHAVAAMPQILRDIHCI